MITFALNIPMVNDCLSPDNIILSQDVDLLAFSGAMEVYASLLFIIAVAQRYQIRLAIQAHCNGYVLGLLEDSTQLVLMLDRFLFSSNSSQDISLLCLLVFEYVINPSEVLRTIPAGIIGIVS